jgi:hypothetical protein
VAFCRPKGTISATEKLQYRRTTHHAPQYGSTSKTLCRVIFLICTYTMIKESSLFSIHAENSTSHADRKKCLNTNVPGPTRSQTIKSQWTTSFRLTWCCSFRFAWDRPLQQRQWLWPQFSIGAEPWCGPPRGPRAASFGETSLSEPSRHREQSAPRSWSGLVWTDEQSLA